MKLLDLSLPTIAENVALDEALLLYAEQAGGPCEFLRLWEPDRPAVVLGRGSRVREEVFEQRCLADGVPLLRRCSGGLSVVADRGCLMYAVVLSYERNPALRAIDLAHRHVRQVLLSGLTRLDPAVGFDGGSDLVRQGRKFSGNSLRCKRTHLLYHGTLLYGMDLALISRYLRHPHREPDYRAGRPHADFLTQLDTTAEALRQALRTAWKAEQTWEDWPRQETERLVRECYGHREWTYRL